MMPFKNNILTGLLIGLVLPLLAYFLSEVLFKDALASTKPGVLYLIAAAVNLVMLKFTYKKSLDKAATGLFIITFLALLLTFIFKIKLR